jgi:hypothetical protein
MEMVVLMAEVLVVVHLQVRSAMAVWPLVAVAQATFAYRQIL